MEKVIVSVEHSGEFWLEHRKEVSQSLDRVIQVEPGFREKFTQVSKAWLALQHELVSLYEAAGEKQ
ncbi:MAG: hypothetical protein ACJ73N_00595 [Bryobacteraceae bacterium]